MEFDISGFVNPKEVILDLNYIQELEGLVIVTTSGDIWKVLPKNKDIDTVGSIENGIYAARWSPNEEFLTIATKNETILLLSSNFDAKNEVLIDEEEQKNKTKVLDATISWRGDSKFFSISYELDGKGRKAVTKDLNLTSFVSPAKSDPEGGLVQCVADKPWPQMKKPLAWQPNGGLIASVEENVVQEDGKPVNRVILWEKNCLRHGEFVVTLDNNFPAVKFLDLKWNKDSDVLSVLVSSGDQQILTLYIRSNYKWFQKKVVFIKAGHQVTHYSWSVNKPARLYLSTTEGNFDIIDIKQDFVTSDSVVRTTQNQSFVIFVDGRTFFVTPFAQVSIPPPMSMNQFTVEDLPLDYAVFDNNLVVITLKKLYLFDLTIGKVVGDVSVAELALAPESHIRNLLLIKENEKAMTLFFNSSAPGNRSRLYQLNLERHATGISISKSQAEIFPPIGDELSLTNGVILSIIESVPVSKVADKPAEEDKDHDAGEVNNKDEPHVFIQTSDGNLLKYRHTQFFPEAFEKVQKLMYPCTKIVAVPVEGDIHFLGLSMNSRLCYDKEILSFDCTSFSVSEGFLLYTTLSSGMYHLLFVYKLDELPDVIQKKQYQNPLATKLQSTGKITDNFRNIERGSKIVAVAKEKLVFEMPRGSIETIYPRRLLCKKVKELFDAEDYKRGFELLRQHKIDLNILFDVDPHKFLANLDKILRQLLTKGDWLNLFILALKNELSDEISLFLDEKGVKHVKEYFKSLKHKDTNKINMICEVIRNGVSAIDRQKYILIVMTTYLKNDPPLLQVALNEIRDMKNEEVNHPPTKVPPHLNPDTMKKYKPAGKLPAREVLEYVCWIADAEKLYEFALTTYDIDLVLMVAELTQRDPKEYRPYLETLKGIPDEVDRRLKINLDLKRYDHAIIELATGNEKQIGMAIDLIRQHKEFQLGLELFRVHPASTNYYPRVRELYGDYLINVKEYKRAAYVFEALGSSDKAIQAYLRDLDWKSVLAIMDKHEYDEKRRNEILEEIYIELTENGKSNTKTAAFLLTTGYKSVEESVAFLVKSGHWKKLMKLALHIVKYPDLVENQLRPALSLAASLKINSLREKTNDFVLKTERLLVCQETKKNMPAFMIDEQGTGTMMSDSDVTSETSEISERSGKTGKSFISGGSKRSTARKPKNLVKRKVKEGSLFEEEYLVEYLDKMKLDKEDLEEIVNLISCLMVYDLYKWAIQLNKEFRAFIKESEEQPLSLAQQKFQGDHPEVLELYPQLKKKHYEEIKINLYFQKIDDIMNNKK